MIEPPRLGMALRVWKHHLRVFAKGWRGALLPPFLDPIVYFLALGFGLGAYVTDIHGVPYEDFVAPALCGSATLWAASFEATYGFFWRMSEGGVHVNMLTTPIEPEDVALGELLWAGTRAVVYACVFLVVITTMGFVDSAWALALPPFLYVGGLAFGAIGLSFAVLCPKMDYFAYYYTLVVNPMFLFGGIFFPVESLPDWAQRLAWLLPTEHLVAIARTLTAGDPTLGVLANGAWLLASAAIMLCVPLHRLRRRLVA